MEWSRAGSPYFLRSSLYNHLEQPRLHHRNWANTIPAELLRAEGRMPTSYRGGWCLCPAPLCRLLGEYRIGAHFARNMDTITVVGGEGFVSVGQSILLEGCCTTGVRLGARSLLSVIVQQACRMTLSLPPPEPKWTNCYFFIHL